MRDETSKDGSEGVEEEFQEVERLQEEEQRSSDAWWHQAVDGLLTPFAGVAFACAWSFWEVGYYV